MSYGRGPKGFEKSFDAVVKAENGEANWDAILVCCDIIRSGDVKHAYVVDKVQRALESSTPSQNMLVLQMLESATKNCGSKLHAAIADKKFMQFLRDHITKSTGVEKHKLLELIQIWNHAFRNQPEYSAIGEVYLQLKGAGQDFPTLVESDAMFSNDGPPDWRESTSCYSCKTNFTTLTRRHHCRNCGQSCCGKCSSKSMPIPKYGYERGVRVCDQCHTKLSDEPSSSSSGGSSKKPKSGVDSDIEAAIKQSLAESQSQSKPAGGKSKQEIEEEEQLQLALAISQSEAEAKESERRKRSNFMSLDAQPPSGVMTSILQSPTAPVMPDIDDSTMTPELQRYLNRNYWQSKQDNQPAATPATIAVKVTQPSAPPAAVESPVYATVSKINEAPATQLQTITPSYPSVLAPLQEEDPEKAEFISALSSSIDVFVNRMKSNSMRGRSIVNDNSVQTIFATLQNMHPQLLTYIQAQEEKRTDNERLQDKLAQLRDAREALNQLRSEHEEKRKREAEELAKRKQIQMAQKLEILRQKKQELLEVRRQQALQRFTQQNDEMRMRFEQQKQETQIRQWQLHGFPQELQPGFAHGSGLQTGDMSQYAQAGQYSGYQQQQYNSDQQQQIYQQQPVADAGNYQSGMYMQPPQLSGAPSVPQQGSQNPPAGYSTYPQSAHTAQPGVQQPSQQPAPSLQQQTPQGAPGMQGIPQQMSQTPNAPGIPHQIPPPQAPNFQQQMPQVTTGQQIPGGPGNYYQGQPTNPYQMQGMNDALAAGYNQPAPGFPQSNSQQYDVAQEQGPATIQQVASYQQPPPPPPAQDDTQLISFD